MQELNQSFVLYTNYSEILTMLSDEDLGKIFRAILIYKKNKEVIELPNQLAVIFALVKNQLDLDELKYNEKCQKNSDNGKRGGAPIGNLNAKKTTQNNRTVVSLDFKTTENNPKQPKTTQAKNKTTQNKHNDNDNDNDNENDNEKDYSFKKENKEKSFQNSDFEENGTNETNEPSLRANAKQSNSNNALLEANKEENKGVFKPPKATDPYINPELDCYFRVYEELCPNLARLRFERRNAQIRELLARFIDEIDDDVGYFKSLCQKANNLKRICEKPIDFKMLINNHIGIFNGKYENDSFDVMDLFKKKQE